MHLLSSNLQISGMKQTLLILSADLSRFTITEALGGSQRGLGKMPIGKFVVRIDPRNLQGWQDTLKMKQWHWQGSSVWAMAGSVSESPLQGLCVRGLWEIIKWQLRNNDFFWKKVMIIDGIRWTPCYFWLWFLASLCYTLNVGLFLPMVGASLICGEWSLMGWLHGMMTCNDVTIYICWWTYLYLLQREGNRIKKGFYPSLCWSVTEFVEFPCRSTNNSCQVSNSFSKHYVQTLGEMSHYLSFQKGMVNEPVL